MTIRSTFNIGAGPQPRSVTKIAPKSPFLCQNRRPIRYGFRVGAKLNVWEIQRCNSRSWIQNLPRSVHLRKGVTFEWFSFVISIKHECLSPEQKWATKLGKKILIYWYNERSPPPLPHPHLHGTGSDPQLEAFLWAESLIYFPLVSLSGVSGVWY